MQVQYYEANGVFYAEFNGNIYKRYTKGKHPNYYYRKWKKDGKFHQELLHRAIYEFFNGAIPKGYVVHHIDGNPFNNDISNLSAITNRQHAIVHEKLKDFATAECARKVCFTPENWHERREKVKQNLQESVRKCEECGNDFVPTNTHQRFCSKKCHHRWQYHAEECNIDMVCQCCGKTFRGNKYLKPKTCSSECAHKLLWQRRKAT